MAVEEEKQTAKPVFDEEAASALAKELRATFASAKTRSYQWRVSQLKSLLKLTTSNEPAIVDALRSDLSKPELESQVYEVLQFLAQFLFNALALLSYTWCSVLAQMKNLCLYAES